MEWDEKEYKKLLNKYDEKMLALSVEKEKSDKIRHEMYTRRNAGEELTLGEEAEIEERCRHEDDLNDKMRQFRELLDVVYGAMDKLDEELEGLGEE